MTMARNGNKTDGGTAVHGAVIEKLTAQLKTDLETIATAQATLVQTIPTVRQTHAALLALGQSVDLPNILGDSEVPVAPARRRGRPAGSTRENGDTLVPMLSKVLSKPMSVTDAAAAVQKSGYKTGSPNFRTIVNAALLKNKKLFKRVSRGIYVSK